MLLDRDDSEDDDTQATVPGNQRQFESPGDTDILAGFSYTFQGGLTFSLEYYHNANAYTGPIEEFAPDLVNADPDDILIRENYLLIQLVDMDLWGVLDIILRHMRDLDDQSSRSIGILEYSIGNHLGLFVIGDYFDGQGFSQYGGVLSYRIFAGAELTF